MTARAVRAQFVERFPLAFAPEGSKIPKRPLARGVHHALFAAFPELPRKAIRDALADYTRGPKYARAMAAPDAWRINLDGEPVEAVGDHGRDIARAYLKRRQRTAQENGPDEGALNPNPHPVTNPSRRPTRRSDSMTKPATIERTATPVLIKPDPNTPAFKTTGREALVIKAGTIFNGLAFAEDTNVEISPRLVPGSDYFVVVQDGGASLELATRAPAGAAILGGFHFAPGGNATARAGGDDIPAINPCSLWDINFRPACPDPRGMAFIATAPRPFWCDIYLTGVNHAAEGASRHGVVIADGSDLPKGAQGKKVKRFDYATAKAALESHGKSLLSVEDFFAAAHGVTEKSAAERAPKTTGLDAARTSRFGIMQATGNLWIWGHDGDPDDPRASILGGSWLGGAGVGSRCAVLGNWSDNSYERLGARGRGDHLRLD